MFLRRLTVVTLAATLGGGAGPVTVALFPFELDDFSAAAGIAGSPAEDAKYLDAATAAVRKLLGDSGRYKVVPVSGPAHEVWGCGCEAPAALKAGAAQSLTGLVTRLSRTEFTVHIRLRDSRTGAVLLERDTGLRIGADYAWDRGAARLVGQSLLAQP